MKHLLLIIALFSSATLGSHAQLALPTPSGGPGSPNNAPAVTVTPAPTNKQLMEQIKESVRSVSHTPMPSLHHHSGKTLFINMPSRMTDSEWDAWLNNVPENQHFNISDFKITWLGPSQGRNTVRHYRISWGVNDKWRGWDKPNTKRRGNGFVMQTDSNLHTFTLPGVKLHPGETLHIRIRISYCCGVKGPWTTITVPHPGN